MTQATFGPAVTLDGPLPKKPRYTLLDAATITVDPASDGTPDGERWANGAQIWAYEGTVAIGWDPCSTGSDRDKSGSRQYNPLPVFGAFVAYKSVVCSSRSFVSWEVFEQRGMAVFNAVESQIVEGQLEGGYYIPTNPYLADGDINSGIVTATPLSPVEALARLSASASGVGRDFVIHASYRMVETWAALHLIEREGNHLVTGGLGTRIITGSGYRGIAPAGQAASAGTVEWIYATGPIGVRRGPALFVPGQLSQALDQTDNEVFGIFERDYLVYWDQALQIGCPVDRSIAW